jgi:hypothetical protein
MLPHPHPWRRLRNLTHVTVRYFDEGPFGWCRHSTQEVFLRSDLTQAQRRATLLHELEHLEAGPAVVGYAQCDERDTRERAARWLIPIDHLAEAMVWAFDDEELAEELWVDVETARTRLSTLTEAESAELNRRLDIAELTFPK